jgi:hypothetical protein
MARTLPEIVPDSPLRARRRRAGLVTVVSISTGIAVRSEFFGPVKPDAMSYVAVAFIFVANVGVVIYGWRAHDGFLVRPTRPVRRGRPFRLGQLFRHGGEGAAYGSGPAAGAGSAPVMAGRWPALRAASRLMPGPAGRRWLAEAQSLLSEVDAGQRQAAARSYLRSVPGLVLMMWLAELSRRARRRLR